MSIKYDNLLGQGIYSIPEAAHIVGLQASRIRRWVNGYQADGGQVYKPVVPAELPEIEGKVALSFHDLLELHFIKAFISEGVKLPAIRKAAKLASEILGVEKHPFVRLEFKTDRRDIMQAIDEQMLNLNKSQYEFEGIITQSLFKGFVYSDKLARAWHPSSTESSVILNPEIALGKPTIENTSIRTRAIFHAWQAEGRNPKTVASMFNLKPKQVKDAVSFEQRMAA
jgi:uncharacterized protein (DUF433 family)/DNA-binding transcriptional MerR regulator